MKTALSLAIFTHSATAPIHVIHEEDEDEPDLVSDEDE